MTTQETIDDIVQKIDDICKFINGSINDESGFKATQKKCDERQQDILHDIELSIMSRKERVNVTKELKELRLERRNAKQLIELLDPFTQLVKNKSALLTSLVALSTKIKDIKKNQSSRTYQKRSSGPTKVNDGQHFEIKQLNGKSKVVAKKQNKK